MTLSEAYFEAKRRLQRAGINNPPFDAACIFERHTGVSRLRLPICGGDAPHIPPAFWRDIDRRCAGEPLQYILGEWEFMGLRFKVGPGVLIPRQETELLAETAIGFLKGRRAPRMLELCAGSGCVAISAVKEVEGLSACCLEYSAQAAGFLRENIMLNEVQSRVHVIEGDMLHFENQKDPPRQLDFIACNPPYIRSADIAGLQTEVKDHEPSIALDGGGDGLAFYRAFAPWASLLRAGGMAAFEVGAGQAGDVAAIIGGAGLSGVFVKKDYSGIERVVGGYK